MQQYTVPQFIDVETQIFGPITVRQFMIFLVTAILCGLSYKIFDFSLFLTISAISVMLAAVLAFVKINGRPFHLFILNLIQTLRRPKLRVWSNKADIYGVEEKIQALKNEYVAAPPKIYKKSRLAELALIVDTKGRYKGE